MRTRIISCQPGTSQPHIHHSRRIENDVPRSAMTSFRNKRGNRRWKYVFILSLIHLLLKVHAQSSAPSLFLPKHRKKSKGKNEPEPAFLSPQSPPIMSQKPSLEPSISEPPRVEPTLFPVVTLRANDVKMTIGGIVLPLHDNSKHEMERIISDGIAYTIDNVLGLSQIENLDIRVVLVAPSERKLESVHTETILFDALIEIQSVLEVHDVDRYTVGAFNDPVEQILFLEALRATDDPAFANVTSVSTSGDYIEQATPLPPEVERKSTRAAVAISILIAIAAVVGAAIALLFYHRQRRKARIEVETSSKSSAKQLDKLENGSIPSDRALNLLETESSSIEEKDIPSEIIVDSSDDDAVSNEKQDDESVDSSPPVALNLPAQYSAGARRSSPNDPPLDTLMRSTSLAPSDEKSESDHLVDTISLLSVDSIDYDFEEIFRTDGSSALRRRESSSTYDSDKIMYGYDREDSTLPSVDMDEYENGKWAVGRKGDAGSVRGSIEKNHSGETKLLDEDDNTVDDEYDEYEGARLLFPTEDTSESGFMAPMKEMQPGVTNEYR